MDLRVKVYYHGPVFGLEGPAIVHEYTEAAVEEVAQVGKDAVDNVLSMVLRNPTPIYQTRIQVERAGADRIINDDNVIYGPWLEGVGSKNKTTRFKGYATFRKTRQWLDLRAQDIAERVLPRFLRRLQ